MFPCVHNRLKCLPLVFGGRRSRFTLKWRRFFTAKNCEPSHAVLAFKRNRQLSHDSSQPLCLTMVVTNRRVDQGVLIAKEARQGTTTLVQRLCWLLVVLSVTALSAVALISAFMGDWPWRFHWLDNGAIDPLLLAVVEEARVQLAGVGMLSVFGFAFALLHNSKVFNRPAPSHEATTQVLDDSNDDAHVWPNERKPTLVIVRSQHKPRSAFMELSKVPLTEYSPTHSVDEPTQQHVLEYLSHTPALIKSLQRAHAANRQDELLALLHSLTLHSQSVRFQSMEACCRQLQQSLQKGRVKETAQLMVELPVLLQDRLEREEDPINSFDDNAYPKAA